MIRCLLFATSLLLSASFVCSQDAAAPALVLFSADNGADVQRIKTREAQAGLADQDGAKALKVQFAASQKYPDVAFTAAEGAWDLSKYAGIRAEVTNTSDQAAKIALRADNEGSANDKKWNSTGANIAAGETRVIEVIFGGEKPGKEHKLDPAKIVAAHLFVSKPKGETSILVKKIEAYGTASAAAAAPAAKDNEGEGDDEGPTDEPVANKKPVVKGKPSDPLLFGFDRPEMMSLVGGLDSKCQVIEKDGKKVLQVETGASKPYPGVVLRAPEGSWNLDRFTRVEMNITNLSEESIQIGGKVDNEGATGKSKSNGGKLSLDPGQTGTLKIDFDREFAMDMRRKLIGMDYTPWGAREERSGVIDPSLVVKVGLFFNKPARGFKFTVNEVRATGNFDPASQKVPQPFFPFLDRYGQYMHADWPGKVKEDSDLQKEKEKELKSITEFPRPKNWDKFGGWADGPKQKATGHFYPLKLNGKWYLVDPEGHLFFSIGMDVVKNQGEAAIDQRDDWFAEKLWETPEFKAHLGKAKNVKRGSFKNSTPQTFSFLSANLQRKYGPSWDETWAELMPQRLMNWGFNTIGNWSDPRVLKTGSIPYTDWVFYFSKKLPWQANTRNPIPDPFEPTFEDDVRKSALKMTKDTANDPYCIGYFVDNELSWHDADSQAKAVMQGDPGRACKQALVKDLEEKYGDIAKLNSAWKTSFASWDALAASKQMPSTPEGIADMRAFNAKIAEMYFGTISKILKEVAPNKLYLGCRFADHNPQVVEIAAKYCDVVSFNIYRDTVAGWKPAAPIDKPVIIGEFHFGATDRGVFGHGLAKADNSQDRADKFFSYVTGAARNPLIVGAHWFALNDEPTIGRALDGENCQIGFVSITDKPYQEMIDASRKAATEIYSVRGK